MFGNFASITIKPQQRDRFLATIRDTALRSVRDEAGCLRFDVFEDLADGNRYHLYEVYTDETAFQDHLDTAHAKRALEGSKEWAEGPFKVIRAASIYPYGKSILMLPCQKSNSTITAWDTEVEVFDVHDQGRNGSSSQLPTWHCVAAIGNAEGSLHA